MDQILSVSIPKAVMSVHARVATRETRHTAAHKSLECAPMAQFVINMPCASMLVEIALGKCELTFFAFPIINFLYSQMQM